MTTFQNNNRIATIRKNAYGEFVASVGYVDDANVHASAMQVCKIKEYKRETQAQKFCQQWIAA